MGQGTPYSTLTNYLLSVAVPGLPRVLEYDFKMVLYLSLRSLILTLCDGPSHIDRLHANRAEGTWKGTCYDFVRGWQTSGQCKRVETQVY